MRENDACASTDLLSQKKHKTNYFSGKTDEMFELIHMLLISN